MKDLKKHIDRINDLLYFNYEVEKIYLDTFGMVSNKDLKAFFRNTGFFRNEFCRVLRGEIIRLGGKPVSFDKLSSKFSKILVKFRYLLDTDNESKLLDEVCQIKELSVLIYNNLLQERNLPLSVCKILVEQRDEIQKTLNTIEVKEQLVA